MPKPSKTPEKAAKPIQGNSDPGALFCAVRRFLVRIGIDPVRHDPEYSSAINFGVLMAVRTWHPDGGRTMLSLAVRLSIREIKKLERHLATWRRSARLTRRGTGAAPTPLPLPLSDRELLCFVARHGKTKAARLLGIDPKTLNNRLDEVANRVREGIALGTPAPILTLDPAIPDGLSYYDQGGLRID